jgi:phosphoglycolate phosphatase/putative hydrolase of the HAD superfamily
MKAFSLPEEKTNLALLFDMDSTLYTHDEYAKCLIDLPVMRLAQKQGKTFEQTNAEITGFRKKWSAAHNGRGISLSNTLVEFGVSIKESIRWREELFRPEGYLAEDKKLRSVLEQLASRFQLALVTNNPVSIAVRTLSVLGVHDIIRKIVGLDTFCISKPDKVIFLEAAHLCGVPPEKCISIGDRYDIDLALPLELGMGGILVDGVADVYKLNTILT